MRDASLQNQSLAGIREVMSAKADAFSCFASHPFAYQIQQTTVFSSTASLLGPAGQANYAAANSVLDAQCQHEQAQGIFLLTSALLKT